jgi:hypothetical protein
MRAPLKIENVLQAANLMRAGRHLDADAQQERLVLVHRPWR